MALSELKNARFLGLGTPYLNSFQFSQYRIFWKNIWTICHCFYISICFFVRVGKKKLCHSNNLNSFTLSFLRPHRNAVCWGSPGQAAGGLYSYPNSFGGAWWWGFSWPLHRPAPALWVRDRNITGCREATLCCLQDRWPEPCPMAHIGHQGFIPLHKGGQQAVKRNCHRGWQACNT